LNNAKRRRLDARSFEKRDEWLRYNVNVHVPSGGARIENNLLTLTLKGDLMLVGTNVHTGLVGDLDTEEGGLGHFQGNEFRIDRGELHFGERDRIAVTIDAHAETQVREFRVQLHAFGPYEDPQVMLTSDPELGRADLVALLTIGATAREQGAYTSTAGASLAGELLMGATGLDRQLKAFLPKNAIIRDLNVNMATQLSDVSGIVEPTAQVEAKIYSDKMKVRFSQPMISGKGRRLQLELRIDDHTYLQGQWDEDPTAPSSGDLGLDLKLRWEFQ
jgi:translocation and assembly module TamB